MLSFWLSVTLSLPLYSPPFSLTIFMVLHYALAYDSYMILADWFTIMDVSVPVHMIRLLLILTKSMHHSMYYLSAMCSRSTPRVLIIAAVS